MVLLNIQGMIKIILTHSFLIIPKIQQITFFGNFCGLWVSFLKSKNFFKYSQPHIAVRPSDSCTYLRGFTSEQGVTSRGVGCYIPGKKILKCRLCLSGKFCCSSGRIFTLFCDSFTFLGKNVLGGYKNVRKFDDRKVFLKKKLVSDGNIVLNTFNHRLHPSSTELY